ncbi:MAG TPA: helix-turn-helix transcriptional regulator [Oculatellaceae cyanobacterium]
MRKGDRPLVFQPLGRSLLCTKIIKYAVANFVKCKMGLVRLRIRELAAEKGWTLKEVAERSGVNYSTVASYARRGAMTMTDFTAIQKLARAFDVMIEDLVEVLEE